MNKQFLHFYWTHKNLPDFDEGNSFHLECGSPCRGRLCAPKFRNQKHKAPTPKLFAVFKLTYNQRGKVIELFSFIQAFCAFGQPPPEF
jgi:hypothetical protein